MARFILRRIGLALITLALLSVLVFVGTQLLPGDVGRRVLGPFATQESVDTLNARLGTDRPVLVQYTDWIGGAVTGDLGESITFADPVSTLVKTALVNSAKLAALAFVIVVPLSVLGGIVAALRRGKLTDRLITVGGLSATVIPEFVSGLILILVFAITLRWLPGTATAPRGSGFLTQLEASAPAGLLPGPGAFRVYRPHHQSRRDRSTRGRLHAHRHLERACHEVA